MESKEQITLNNNSEDKSEAATPSYPIINRRIGNRTYRVQIHFSETSKLTATDRMKRVLVHEARNM